VAHLLVPVHLVCLYLIWIVVNDPSSCGEFSLFASGVVFVPKDSERRQNLRFVGPDHLSHFLPSGWTRSCGVFAKGRCLIYVAASASSKVRPAFLFPQSERTEHESAAETHIAAARTSALCENFSHTHPIVKSKASASCVFYPMRRKVA